MKAPSFCYYRPGDVEEAVTLIAERGPEAKVLAGGQSLVPLMNFRLAAPEHLIDITGLDDLQQVTETDGELTLGAGVTQASLEGSALVASRLPLMAATLPFVGHRAIRNRGTIGGSLAHADPAAELPAVALAHDARMTAMSRQGTRQISATEFFDSYFETALRDDEILTHITFPTRPSSGGTRHGWQEVARRHGDFGLVGVGVLLATNETQRLRDVRVVASGVGAAPVRCTAAEHVLENAVPDETTLRAAARATSDVDPPSDMHASSDYRRHLLAVLIARTLRRAIHLTNHEEEGL